MKFYLGTSSINFNNIFTTSSISPVGFYKRRLFGSNVYIATENESFEKGIILYRKKPKIFFNNNSELIEYPIIFEINKNPKELIKIDEDTYISNKTIYFNLDNIRVYFEDASDMNKVIKRSIYALETKEVVRYLKNMKKISKHDKKNIIKHKSDITYIYDEEYFMNELNNDNFFDTIKGLYYGLILHEQSFLYIQNYESYDFLENLEHIVKEKKGSIEHSFFKNIYDYAKKGIKEYLKKDDDLLFDVSEKNRKIKLNDNLFNEYLDKKDQDILNLIYNEIISINSTRKDRFSNDYVESLVVNIGSKINHNQYKKDIRNIYLRIVKNNLDISYNTLESEVLKCLYIVLLKTNNYNSIKDMSEDKNIDNKFLIYSIYCSILGFANMPQHITSKLYSNNIKSEYINKNIMELKGDIHKFYRSEDIYVKQIYELLFNWKQADNQRNIRDNYDLIEEREGIKIRSKNIGTMLNIDIECGRKYRLVLYIKKYKVQSNKFREELLRLNMSKKGIRGKFPYFSYSIYDNQNLRYLTYKEEKDFLEVLKKINIYS